MDVTWVFSNFVANSWNNALPIKEAIENFSTLAMVWKRDVYGNNIQRKRILARLNGIQRSLMVRDNQYLSSLEIELKRELDDLLRHEELY